MPPPYFHDSGRYASGHAQTNGPGDARPIAEQIILDNDLVGKLKDKVVLLTGGSNGIGVEEVRSLASTGARIVFTSRDLAKGEKVREAILQKWNERSVQPRIDVLRMDLQSLESVRAGAEEFKKTNSALNILVNNAGIALTPQKLTVDGFEQQFGVNHLAHFYLFLLLQPLLIGSSTTSFASRVINVASSAHHLGSVKIGDYNFEKAGYGPFSAYASSKTCNVWMANEIERRYSTQGLHSISVHPGGILTGLQAHRDEQAARMIEESLKHPEISRRMKSVKQGAASVVLAALGKEYEGIGGFYMEDCTISAPFPKDGMPGLVGYMPWAYDESGASQLWEDSIKLLKPFSRSPDA